MKNNMLINASAIAFLAMTGVVNAQDQGTLKIRLNADIRSNDPGINRDANTDAVMLHIVEGLVGYRSDTSVSPMLAESIEVADNGKDYTFKLRHGVKFQNGKPLTADDVLFAWKRYMTPENNWRCLKDFDGSNGDLKVTNVVAVDEQTVRFTLDKPFALFLTTMARPDCGSTGIYQRESVGVDGKWDHPIGTGPFKWKSWVRGQYIDLDRYEGYSALSGKPDGLVGNKTALVPAVRFVVIPDPSAAKAGLLSGSVDVLFDVANADMEELKTNDTLKLEAAPNMELNALLFQTRDPVMKDKRLREAISLSIDLPAIVQAVAGEEAKASISVVPSPSAYYGAAQSKLPPRDLEKAKALLAEAGYAGQPIKMVTTKQYQSLFDTAVLVQAMAAEAGINIELEVLDWATELDRYQKGAYQMMSFSYSARLDPALSFDMIGGDKEKQPRKVWDNPEARKALSRTLTVTDRAERQAIFDDVEAMYRADMPMVATYSPVSTSAVRKNVEGYAGWALGQPRAWGVTLVKD